MDTTRKIGSAPARRPSPFRRDSNAPAMTFEGGQGAAKNRSLASLLNQIGIARPTPGGNDEVEDVLVDSWAVAACIDKWAQAVRGVPMRIWASDSDDAEEVPENHPLRQLFNGPVPWMGSADLLEASVVHYLVSGEDWWMLMGEDSLPITADVNPRARIPIPRWILPVSGEFVQDKRDTRLGRIQYVQYAGQGTHMPDFALGSTVQHRRYNRRDPQRGQSPLDAAMRAISVGFQAERYQEGVMRSGGPGAYLRFKEEMAPEEERRVQDEANESNRDPEVLGGVKVLSGDVEVTPNPATPKDMLPSETLNWSRNVVCSSLGVPPPVVGVFDDAAYNNITEAYRQFWSNVKSWLDAWAAKVNESFIARLTDARLAGCRISFDFSGVQALQSDNTAKFIAAKDIATSGVRVSYADALIAQGVEADMGEGAETIVSPFGIQDYARAAGESDPDDDQAEPESGPATPPPVSGVLEVVTAVSEGRLTPDAGQALLLAAFPDMDPALAARVVAGATPIEEPEPPEDDPPPAPPPQGDEDEDAPPEDEGKALSAPARSIPPLPTPEERANYHDRLVERVMAKPERELSKAVEAWFLEYESVQIQRLADYAENGPRAERGMEPLQRDFGLDEDIERFLLLIEDRWRRELSAMARSPLENAFVGALDDIAQELSVVQINATDPRVAQALATQQIRLSEGVTSRLAETVKQTILEGLANPGADAAAPLQLRIRNRLPELTEELRRVFGTREARAATIARTETAEAVSTARAVQMKDAGITETQWVANNDAATRDSHRELDGEVRRIGEEFKPGLRRPHDPDAPADETINCRCAAKPIVP